MAAKKSASKKGSNTALAMEIGAGVLAAAAAAGAGYYFYAAPDAKKHRASASKWAKGLKDDVMKEAKKDFKKMQKLDRKAVAVIVDKAAAAYQGARNVNPEQLREAVAELKANWKQLEADVSGKKAAPKKAAPKKAAPKKAAAKK